MRIRRAWALLAGAFVIAIGYNAYIIAPASILPLLATEFGIEKATAGLTISAVYVSWAALQLPGGLLMDRYDNRRLVGVGLLTFLVATTASVFAPTYPTFLLSRILGGAAAVFVWTATTNVVVQSFPKPRRALGTSVFVASASAGFGLAQYVGPLIADAYGWRAVFPVYFLVSLAGLPLFVFAARDPVRNESAISLGDFATALRQPAILTISGASFCSYSLYLFLNSWMPAYATEVHGIDLAAAGAATALVPLSGLLARPGGGWLSDLFGGRRRAVVLIAFTLCLPILLALAAADSATLFAPLLLVAGFASQLGIGVFYVYAGEVAPDDQAGTGLAVLTTCSVLGSLITPAVTGWLIQALSWTAAFGYGLALAVLGIVFAVRAPKA